MIYTRSKFSYGHTVDLLNKFISFSEGGDELIAEIEIGDYTLGEYAQAVEDALNAAGDLTYNVTVDRLSGQLTIFTDGGNFELLIDTGNATATAYEMMGFESENDLVGATSYTGNRVSGSEYYPQFFLQSYVPPENYVESSESIVNQSADGRTEVIRFGTRRKIEMDIKFITDKLMDGEVIRNNPTGVQNARDFLGYISQKKRFEFMPNLLDGETYYPVILETFPGSANGTGFRLKELFGQNLPDYYETGVFTLRVVEV